MFACYVVGEMPKKDVETTYSSYILSHDLAKLFVATGLWIQSSDQQKGCKLAAIHS